MFDIVSENCHVVGTNSEDFVVRGEFGALNGLAPPISSFSHCLQLIIQHNEASILHAHNQVLSLVGKRHDIARCIQFGIFQLAVGVQIPHTEQAIITECKHFGLVRVHSKAPQFSIEMRSHVDCRCSGLCVEFEYLATSCTYQASITTANFSTNTSDLSIH